MYDINCRKFLSAVYLFILVMTDIKCYNKLIKYIHIFVIEILEDDLKGEPQKMDYSK